MNKELVTTLTMHDRVEGLWVHEFLEGQRSSETILAMCSRKSLKESQRKALWTAVGALERDITECAEQARIRGHLLALFQGTKAVERRAA